MYSSLLHTLPLTQTMCVHLCTDARTQTPLGSICVPYFREDDHHSLSCPLHPASQVTTETSLLLEALPPTTPSLYNNLGLVSQLIASKECCESLPWD